MPIIEDLKIPVQRYDGNVYHARRKSGYAY